MYEDTLQAVTWGTAFSIVDAVCCEKEERHDIHIDKDKAIPSFLSLSVLPAIVSNVALEFVWAFYSFCGVCHQTLLRI
jgi:hypothetical protein